MLKTLKLVKIFFYQIFNFNKLKEKNKKGKSIGIVIGIAILIGIIYYGFLFVTIFTSLFRLAKDDNLFSISEALYLPIMMMTFISVFFILISGNRLSFSDKDISILGPLPINEKKIVLAKLIVCYLFESIFQFYIAICAIIALFMEGEANYIFVVDLIVVAMFATVLPMLLFSFVVLLIRKAIMKSKHRRTIEMIFTFLLIGFIVVFSLLSSTITSTDNIVGTINSIGKIITYYPFLYFIQKSLLTLNPIYTLIYIILSLFVGFLFVEIFSKYAYKLMINYKYDKEIKVKGPIEYKKKSVKKFLLKQEFERLKSSSVYITNILATPIMGIIFAVILVITRPFDAIDNTISFPIYEVVSFAFISFVTSMAFSPACSLSLDWKYIWILRSLPIDENMVFMSKIKLNLILQLSSGIITLIILSIGFSLNPIWIFAIFISMVSMSLFTSFYYQRINLKHPKTGVEDVVIVKQSASVLIASLTSFAILIVHFMVVGGLVFLFKDAQYLSVLIIGIIDLILAYLYYNDIRKNGKKYYENFS